MYLGHFCIAVAVAKLHLFSTSAGQEQIAENRANLIRDHLAAKDLWLKNDWTKTPQIQSTGRPAKMARSLRRACLESWGGLVVA